ncbi:hypothetical protein Tco_0911797 [Tanacetum coccineum]
MLMLLKVKSKESIHVEFQDVVVHGIRVNTIVNSSFTVTKGIEIDAFKAQVEDVKIEDYQVDESEVDEVVVEFFEGWKPLSPLQLAVEEVMSE